MRDESSLVVQCLVISMKTSTQRLPIGGVVAGFGLERVKGEGEEALPISSSYINIIILYFSFS